MAKAQNAPEPVEDDPSVTMAADAAEYEWETVADASPTKVIFEEIGDTFFGVFEGKEHIEPTNGEDPFDLWVFAHRGVRYGINNSYKMEKNMEAIAPGTPVKLTLVNLIKVSGQPSPMKDLKIEAGKAKRA